MSNKKKQWLTGAESWVGSAVGTLVIGTLVITHLMNTGEIRRAEVVGLEQVIVAATNYHKSSFEYGEETAKTMTTTTFTEKESNKVGGAIIVSQSKGDNEPRITDTIKTTILEHHRTPANEVCTVGVSRGAKQVISYDTFTRQLRATGGACENIDIDSRAEILWEQLDPKM